ncbi:MAG: M23 family metallopeptidase [Bacilli bacterium]|nr:M23 family metallopeptidase [Bacilli bacterium]
MKHLKWRFNLCLIFITVIGIYIFFAFDSVELNALFKGEDSLNLVINEVNIAQKNDTSSNISKVTLLSNNVNRWVIPVEGDYVITTYYENSHKAVDLYSNKGYDSNILAANSGEVIGVYGGCDNEGSYCNGRRGNYVVIKHNVSNYYTVYMHLHNIYVKVGDKVNSGGVIASMGNTGYVIPARTNSSPYNGTHLHFCLFVGEPYKGGYAINPMDLY